MTVVHLPGTGEVRFAYAIARRAGPAVVRNRLRRRLRAAVSDLDRTSGGLAPGAYLVVVRPEAVQLGYRELHRSLGLAIVAATGAASSGASR